MTRKVPGHIVEIGLFKIFGQLIKNYGEKIQKNHGIDTFDGYSNIDLIEEKHLNSERWKDIEIDIVSEH